jgi:hypothetical protein
MPAKSPIEYLWYLLFALFIWTRIPVGFAYLKYVDLGQVGKELKRAFGGWLFLSAVVTGIRIFRAVFPSSPETASFIDNIPYEALYVFLFLVATWLLGGITVSFPKLTFKQWIAHVIVICAAATILYTASLVLPQWALEIIAISFWIALQMYEALIVIGKQLCLEREGVDN